MKDFDIYFTNPDIELTGYNAQNGSKQLRNLEKYTHNKIEIYQKNPTLMIGGRLIDFASVINNAKNAGEPRILFDVSPRLHLVMNIEQDSSVDTMDRDVIVAVMSLEDVYCLYLRTSQEALVCSNCTMSEFDHIASQVLRHFLYS